MSPALLAVALALLCLPPAASEPDEEVDCFWFDDAEHGPTTRYHGRTNTTASGLPCLPWTLAYRNGEERTFQNVLNESVGDAKNYCRDPSSFSMPWCYYSVTPWMNEICDVPYCTPRSEHATTSSLNHCFINIARERMALYLGLESRTMSGNLCRPWHRVTDPATLQFIRANQGLTDLRNAGNFCRDMLGLGKPWCYTDGNMTKVELCGVPPCSPHIRNPPDFSALRREDHVRFLEEKKKLLENLTESDEEVDCFWLEDAEHGPTTRYHGRTNTTASGLPCLPWTLAYRNGEERTFQNVLNESVGDAKNYCRDPTSFSMPWCYYSVTPWMNEICDVPYCTPRSEHATTSSLNHCFINIAREGMALYLGLESRTMSGNLCRPWHRVTDPATLQFIRANQGLRDLRNAGNFCRDMLGLGKPWCYADGNMTKVELCGVPPCSPQVKNPPDFSALRREDHVRFLAEKKKLLENLAAIPQDCFYLEPAYLGWKTVYGGVVNTSASGASCELWSSRHMGTLGSSGLENNTQDMNNYCRDPTNFGRPWCYVRTESNVTSEVCDVPYCAHRSELGLRVSLHHCYKVLEAGSQFRALYLGLENRAISGLTCQRWSLVRDPDVIRTMRTVHGVRDLKSEGNFCRDMSGLGVPWCYTRVTRGDWEPCPVPECPKDSQKLLDLNQGSDFRNDSEAWMLMKRKLLDDLATYHDECFWVYADGVSQTAMYRGVVNTSASGLTCHPWDRVEMLGESSKFYAITKEDVRKVKNSCRDLTGYGLPWCQIREGNDGTDGCAIPYCSQRSDKSSSLNDCYLYQSKAYWGRALYYGLKNTTASGKACLPWSDVTHLVPQGSMTKYQGFLDPRALGNFCRDVNGLGIPWCFTATEWEPCDILPCTGNFTHPPDFSDVYREDLEAWVQERNQVLSALKEKEEARLREKEQLRQRNQLMEDLNLKNLFKQDDLDLADLGHGRGADLESKVGDNAAPVTALRKTVLELLPLAVCLLASVLM